jgi:uncharacterized protein YhdP
VKRHPWLTKRPLQIVLAVLVVLVGLRIALPYIVLKVVNDKLASLEGYRGRAEDVDISLYRGAYTIEGIRIVKTDGRVPVPFFRVRSVDISVDWSALLDGAIVAEVVMRRPQLNFVNAENDRNDQTGEGADWQATVRGLVPIKINELRIRDGQVHFRDFGRDPAVNIYVQNVYLTISNLTNSERLSRDFVARARGRGLAMHSGAVRVRANIDPFAEKPTFDLWLSMRNMNLPELNPFLDGYAGVDAEGGKFSLYTEIHSREGRFRGYVKPIIEGAEIFDLGGETEGFFTQAWEALVALTMEILSNQPSDPDRFASRIPVSGRIDDPETDTWSAIGQILKNAFIRALSHGLEGSASA